jgi:hypothetical protein
VASQDFFLSDWNVRWIGARAILRTAITLFQKDAKSCIDKTLRAEISNEWSLINRHKDDHPVFWEFLKKERDNIIHAYEWGAYQMWMGADGSLSAPKLHCLRDGREIRTRPTDATRQCTWHRSSNLVDERLCNHPAILRNAEWY